MTFLRRFLRNRTAAIGAIIIVVYMVLALLAPMLAPYDPVRNNLIRRLQPPSGQHWLGNDEMGRDILSRLLWGARLSLIIALGAVGLAIVVGVPAGLMAGYWGGRVDAFVSGWVDVLMAFPGLLLALAVVAIFGFGTEKLILAVGVYSIPTYVRLARASTMAIRNSEYILAARAIGQVHWRIMVFHALPNITGPLIVETTLRLGTVVLTAATLSFLGLGVQPPQPEWGSMIASARTYLRVAPHATLIPGIALAVFVLGFNLAGDGLRDALDPTMKNQIE